MDSSDGRSAAPGWYPDPHDPRMARWFDGRDWTQRTRPIPSLDEPPSPLPPSPFVPAASPRGATDPSSSALGWSLVAVLAVAVVVIIGVAVVVAVSGGGGSAIAVQLQPIGDPGPDPFTDSVVTADEGVLTQFGRTAAGDAGAADPSGAALAVAPVAGSHDGLYGSMPQGAACDADALVQQLRARPEVASRWAELMGTTVDGIDGTVRALAPVVLSRDTAVTNHAYRNRSSAFQAVLQAGTPVLVDDRGVPRVKCDCGNPLAPAQVVGRSVTLRGERWDGFRTAGVVQVEQAAEPMTELPTVDVATLEPRPLPVGSPSEALPESTTTVPPVPPPLELTLRGVGPVQIGADAASAIGAGGLTFERDDVCTAEIDGTTEDDSYAMPAPPGTEVSVIIIEGSVFSYRVSGRWQTTFGVASGQNVHDAASRFRAEGWDVTVSGEDDIFGPGRLEAIRGEEMFTAESDASGAITTLSVPRPIYCD